MKEVKINKEAAIKELARRVRRNENGVKHYLQSAGIQSDVVTLQDIQALAKINPAAFRQMCYFLYPELPTEDVAAADGKSKTPGGESDGVNVTDENGNSITSTAGSSVDWTSILNGIVSTAGVTLTGIFAKQQDNSAAAAYMQQEKDMKLILGIVAFVLIAVIIFAVIVIKRKK